MGWSRSRFTLSAIMATVLVSVLVELASSQGLPRSPYGAPSAVEGGLDWLRQSTGVAEWVDGAADPKLDSSYP